MADQQSKKAELLLAISGVKATMEQLEAARTDMQRRVDEARTGLRTLPPTEKDELTARIARNEVLLKGAVDRALAIHREAKRNSIIDDELDAMLAAVNAIISEG